jgi:hypothetical protein
MRFEGRPPRSPSCKYTCPSVCTTYDTETQAAVFINFTQKLIVAFCYFLKLSTGRQHLASPKQQQSSYASTK